MNSFYHYQRQDSMSFGVKTPFDKYKLPSTVAKLFRVDEFHFCVELRRKGRTNAQMK